ncbi:ABC transporter permease [Streptomyces sp. ISL-94]|uniref:ABC transporter permease n=1 Tax=Streptomyces sp. ISL-94 TaxID=2819190 RepID=UPI001BE5D3ED|nr:ABC transporter permease [Streptomyces sp. ISL-94]MBT2478772.1 ABC transporter permease [Streptomyces sp. ISL-94]
MTNPMHAAFVGRGARMTALVQAEMIMLARNRSALVAALVLPLGSLWLLHSATPSSFNVGQHETVQAGGVLATGTIGMVFLFVVYSTLVNAYVARREGMVLKRLQTGELTDGEILAGTALPAAGLALGQCAVVIGIGITVLDLPVPANAVVLLIGVLSGTVLAAALAACSSVLTRTVEMAQLTTMPVLLASMAGSGLVFPLAAMPAWLADVCRLLPLTPSMEMVRIGWLGVVGAGTSSQTGTGVWSMALPQIGGAVLWTAAAVWAARRWFRWESRK